MGLSFFSFPNHLFNKYLSRHFYVAGIIFSTGEFKKKKKNEPNRLKALLS